MPKFGEVAVVAGTGNDAATVKAALSGKPDGDVAVTAWMAYESMLSDAQRKHAEEIPGVEEGVPWLRWRGSLASVLRDLQLITPDYNHQTVEDDTTRRNVSKHLSRTGNAICVYRTNGTAGSPPVWALRSQFREAVPAPSIINRRALGRLPGEPMPDDEDESKAGTAVTVTVPSAPRQVTPKAGRPAGTSDRRQLKCANCDSSWDSEYLFRHNVKDHGLDVVQILTDAVRQRVTRVRSPELAELLSQSCGGGVVSTSYIGKVLKPLADDPLSPVFAVRAFKDFWYEWNESVAKIGTTHATPVANVDSVVQSMPPGPLVPPSTEPATAAGVHMLEAAAATSREREARLASYELSQPTVAHFEPAVPSSNGSHAPTSAPERAAASRTSVIAAAFQRAEDAMQIVYQSLDEAKAAAEDIAMENEELRGYRDRVKRLLELEG